MLSCWNLVYHLTGNLDRRKTGVSIFQKYFQQVDWLRQELFTLWCATTNPCLALFHSAQRWQTCCSKLLQCCQRSNVSMCQMLQSSNALFLHVGAYPHCHCWCFTRPSYLTALSMTPTLYVSAARYLQQLQKHLLPDACLSDMNSYVICKGPFMSCFQPQLTKRSLGVSHQNAFFLLLLKTDLAKNL